MPASPCVAGTEDRTGQMRHIGNLATSLNGPADIRHKVEHTQSPCRHGQHAPQEHRLLWEVPDKNGQHSHHRAAGTDQKYLARLIWLANLHAHQPRQAGQDNGHEIKTQELSPTHDLLNLAAKEPKREHIEGHVPRVARSVDKPVGDKLPRFEKVLRQISLQRQKIIQWKIVGPNEVCHPDPNVHHNDCENSRPLCHKRRGFGTRIAAVRKSHEVACL